MYFYGVLRARPSLDRELPDGLYQTEVLVLLPGNWSLLGFPSFILFYLSENMVCPVCLHLHRWLFEGANHWLEVLSPCHLTGG